MPKLSAEVAEDIKARAQALDDKIAAKVEKLVNYIVNKIHNKDYQVNEDKRIIVRVWAKDFDLNLRSRINKSLVKYGFEIYTIDFYVGFFGVRDDLILNVLNWPDNEPVSSQPIEALYNMVTKMGIDTDDLKLDPIGGSLENPFGDDSTYILQAVSKKENDEELYWMYHWYSNGKNTRTRLGKNGPPFYIGEETEINPPVEWNEEDFYPIAYGIRGAKASIGSSIKEKRLFETDKTNRK